MTKPILNAPKVWQNSFPLPAEDAHKYARGHLAVFGGEDGMEGAAALAALSAQRLSCGMVTIVTHPATHAFYKTVGLSLMTYVIDAVHTLPEWLERRKVKALIMGPGLSPSDKTRRFAMSALQTDLPLVFDAGVISSFASDNDPLFEMIANRDAPVVLTPHEGEFTRLFGTIDNRAESAQGAAIQSGATIILKGAETLIASPDAEVIIQKKASPWLATAGSGDVLAGLVGSLLASGMDEHNASAAAVWCHTEAGNLAAPGLIPEDLIAAIPQVVEEIAG